MQKQTLRGALVVILAFAAGYFGFLLADRVTAKRQATSASSAAATTPAQSAAPVPARAATQPVVQTSTNPGAPNTPNAQNAQPAPSQPAALRRPAPERVFYLTERVSVMTEAGVIGVKPGTQVLLLEQLPNGNLKLTDGPEDFEVTPDQITNDPQIANLAKRQDRAAQQALAAWKQRQIRPPLPPNITPPQPPEPPQPDAAPPETNTIEAAPPATLQPEVSAVPPERDADSNPR